MADHSLEGAGDEPYLGAQGTGSKEATARLGFVVVVTGWVDVVVDLCLDVVVDAMVVVVVRAAVVVVTGITGGIGVTPEGVGGGLVGRCSDEPNI
jgi:hypothetical protein